MSDTKPTTSWPHCLTPLESYLNTKQEGRWAERERQNLIDLLNKVATSYPNDPGTPDLDDEQPVHPRLTLKEVRFVWGIKM